MFHLCLAFSAVALLPLVSAHGQIKGVLANGVYNNGPNIYYSGDAKNAETAVRVMYKASGPAYNLPTDFSDDSKMACEGASGAPKTIQATAGSDVRIDWVGATSELLNKPGTGNVDWASGEFPWVHAMGTVATYIAPCSNGDCTTFDASQASWVKLQMDGLDMSQSISSNLRSTMAGKPEPYTPSGAGLWGMAKFVEDGSQATVTIPAGLKNGQYLVRHELMAVHNPLKSGDSTSGPQVYNGCIQFEVIGGGNVELPEGTKAGSLYAPNGDFAKYNVYSNNGAGFTNPGPAVWDQVSSGASSSSGSGSSDSGSSSTYADGSSESASSASPTTTSDASASTSAYAYPSSSESAAAAQNTSSSSSSGTCKQRKRSASSKRRPSALRMTTRNIKKAVHARRHSH
ncbi:hypothetical protein D9757_011392 [Collybiopsis confluens]|uniref:lytic cellulose monooxygenase (C4-dehydrogenating) n=1 Tax=Collybiopsis confluens TaxID=2823264 RepID=A0A8H5GLI0_9AGAR|nr:hypothetical protein D9757_011392 [Collybiopsis confluens]